MFGYVGLIFPKFHNFTFLGKAQSKIFPVFLGLSGSPNFRKSSRQRLRLNPNGKPVFRYIQVGFGKAQCT